MDRGSFKHACMQKKQRNLTSYFVLRPLLRWDANSAALRKPFINWERKYTIWYKHAIFFAAQLHKPTTVNSIVTRFLKQLKKFKIIFKFLMLTKTIGCLWESFKELLLWTRISLFCSTMKWLIKSHWKPWKAPGTLSAILTQYLRNVHT